MNLYQTSQLYYARYEFVGMNLCIFLNVLHRFCRDAMCMHIVSIIYKMHKSMLSKYSIVRGWDRL